MSKEARKAGYRPVSSRCRRDVAIADGTPEYSREFPQDAAPRMGNRPKPTALLGTDPERGRHPFVLNDRQEQGKQLMFSKIMRGSLVGALVALASGSAIADTEQVEYSDVLGPVQTTHPTTASQMFIGTGAGTEESAGILVINLGSQILIEDDGSAESGIHIGNGNGRTGLLVVTGPGSAIVNDVGNPATMIGLFVGAGGGTSDSSHGVVSIVDGGRIDADGVRIGHATQATGVINVAGANSSLNFPRTFFDAFADESGGARISPFLHVGNRGHGVLNVVDGGKVLMDAALGGLPEFEFSMTLAIARRSTGSGAVNVIGTGSEIKMLGDGAGFYVGRQARGSLKVADGGLVQLGPNANFDEPIEYGPFMQIGRDVTGSGGVDVIGATSKIEILGDDAYLAVGREGTGSLRIDQGGSVVLGPGAEAGVTVQAGRDTSGAGQIRVAGANSSLEVVGESATIQIGRGGSGSMTIAAGGSVIQGPGTPTSTFGNTFQLGRNASATGQLHVTGTDSVLRLLGGRSLIQVGRSGSGSLKVSDGGSITLGPGVAEDDFSAGLQIARDTVKSRGTVEVTGPNSTITLLGDSGVRASGFLTVGQEGTGTLKISDGGSVIVEDTAGGITQVGRSIGGVGTIHMTGPSSLQAGAILRLGLEPATLTSSGVGTLILDTDSVITVGDASNPGLVEIGPNGTVFSKGLIDTNGGAVINQGVFNPGFSPGTATINGELVTKSGGLIRLEVFGTGSGQFDRIVATNNILFEEGSTCQVILGAGVTLSDLPSLSLLNSSASVGGTAQVVVIDEDGTEIFNESVDISTVGGCFGPGLAGTVTVDIDIKPGSDPNCFNSDGNGVIPVAILGSAEFDVATIDIMTIELDSQPVAVKAEDKIMCHLDDINSDGVTDLVCQIEDVDLTYEVGTGIGLLTGNLLDGTDIAGDDSICVTQ